MNKAVKLLYSYILCFFLCTPLPIFAESGLSKVFRYSNILFVYDGLDKDRFTNDYLKKIVIDISNKEALSNYSEGQIYSIPENNMRFLILNRENIDKRDVNESILKEFARNTTYVVYLWNKDSAFDSRFAFFDKFYQFWSMDECDYQFGNKSFNLNFRVTNDKYDGNNFAERTLRVRNQREHAMKTIFVFDGTQEEYQESMNCGCEEFNDFCDNNCKNKNRELFRAVIQGGGPYYGYNDFITRYAGSDNFFKPERMYRGQSPYSSCKLLNPLSWCKSPELAYVSHENGKKKGLFGSLLWQ